MAEVKAIPPQTQDGEKVGITSSAHGLRATSVDAPRSPCHARRRRILPIALVLVAVMAWTVFDAKQLAGDAHGRLFHSTPAVSDVAPSYVSVLSHASIGDVVWGECGDSHAVKGAECGYAM